MPINKRQVISNLIIRIQKLNNGGTTVYSEDKGNYVLYYVMVNGVRKYFKDYFTKEDYAAYESIKRGSYVQCDATGNGAYHGTHDGVRRGCTIIDTSANRVYA